jgi:hypothetical protein
MMNLSGNKLYLLGFCLAILYLVITGFGIREGFDRRTLGFGHTYYNRFHDTHVTHGRNPFTVNCDERHYNPNDYKARQLASRDILYLI